MSAHSPYKWHRTVKPGYLWTASTGFTGCQNLKAQLSHITTRTEDIAYINVDYLNYTVQHIINGFVPDQLSSGLQKIRSAYYGFRKQYMISINYTLL